MTAYPRQQGFVNRHGTCGRLRAHFVYIDRQGRGRQIAIAVFDGVGERVGAAISIRRGYVTVAAIRIQGQDAQSARDRRASVARYWRSSVIARFDTHHATAGIFAIGAKLVV